ncbi:MAG: DUF1688 family protein [Rubrivivax sp.]
MPEPSSSADTPLPAPSGRDPLASLWLAGTVRARSAAVASAVADGRSGWFSLHPEAQAPLVQQLVDRLCSHPMGAQMPGLGVWRQLDGQLGQRRQELEQALASRSPSDALRARLDFACIAALMGHGAGPAWSFDDNRAHAVHHLALPVHRQGRDDLLAMLNQASGNGADTPSASSAPPAEPAPASPVDIPANVSTERLTGSEGLTVALLRGFMAGSFSADADDPLRVDARVLSRIDAAALRALFQASQHNPLPGLDARAATLQRWGRCLEAQGQGPGSRPNALLDPWRVPAGPDGPVPVDPAAVLERVVSRWAEVFRADGRVLGLPAGDVWPHLWAGAASPGVHGSQGTPEGERAVDPGTGGWLPLHQPAQWLVFSLLEPLAQAGLALADDQGLTALAAGRAGAMLLDSGIAVPRATPDLQREWKVGDSWIIEWRALTLHCMTQVAEQARAQCAARGLVLTLAQVLQQGVEATISAHGGAGLQATTQPRCASPMGF